MSKTRDFTKGPIFFEITRFALPIMLTGFLQIAYSMADNIIVGRFSGDPLALGAVGSTNSLNNLIINLLIGIGAGSGVIASQFYGAKKNDSVNKSVHTAITFAILSGIIMSALAFGICEDALIKLGTKPELLSRAVLYSRIICLGIPANTVYNFGAAILRGTGNSRSPLMVLSLAGLSNVLLNLFFVIVCGMSVSGVAIATVISQYASAVAVLLILNHKKDEPYHLDFKKLRMDKDYLVKILRLGVPSGVASSMFSIANVLITSAFNTLPTETVTGITIATNIDALTLTTMNCFGQASMTFVGQNYGAKKPDRIKKTLAYCAVHVFIVGSLFSLTELVFSRQLVGLYMDDSYQNPELIIEAAITVITLMLSTYLIAGFLDTVSGGLKGLGCTFTAMMINLVCICGFRIVWIYTVFKNYGTLISLYLCYPISWTIALITASVFFVVRYMGVKKKSLQV